MKKILVLSPHPDDDIIGCGGSIAKHVRAGNKVTIIYMTSGEAGSPKYSKQELGKIREAEAKNAASILGVDDLIFLRNPDGYLEYNERNLEKIKEIIREKCPDIIYSPHKNDAHKDHIVTNKLTVEGVRGACNSWYQQGRGLPYVLLYEVWTPLQEFSHVENITDLMDLKLRALREHVSSLKEIRYDEAVKALNRYRGIMTGKGSYCECFFNQTIL